jgi:hypothetical protein
MQYVLCATTTVNFPSRCFSGVHTIVAPYLPHGYDRRWRSGRLLAHGGKRSQGDEIEHALEQLDLIFVFTWHPGDPL